MVRVRIKENIFSKTGKIRIALRGQKGFIYNCDESQIGKDCKIRTMLDGYTKHRELSALNMEKVI